MKRYAIIFSFLLSAFCVFGQERHGSHRCHEKYEVTQHHRLAYFVSGNEMFFQGQPVKDASESSFDFLCDGYTKDNLHTCYWGYKIGN